MLQTISGLSIPLEAINEFLVIIFVFSVIYLNDIVDDVHDSSFTFGTYEWRSFPPIFTDYIINEKPYSFDTENHKTY